MADGVNEESDYNPGKNELGWGYEEGRPALVFISMWRDAGKYGVLYKTSSQSETMTWIMRVVNLFVCFAALVYR